VQTEDQNDCKKNTTTVSGLPLPATIAGALANASAQGAAAIAAAIATIAATIATIQISTAAAASAGHYA
jgi:CRISPR/Cas system-associated protein Cas5 (RAMP superfamily)